MSSLTRYRVLVSNLQLSRGNDIALFQAAFEKLEKALGGAITNVSIYSDPMTSSYVVEAEAAPKPSGVYVSPYAQNVSISGGQISGANYARLAGMSWTYSTAAPIWSDPTPVYLAHEDVADYVHPDRPEPMWSTQPITGWRYFVWDQIEHRLRGNRLNWPASYLVAECGKRDAHRSPNWDCECGIYLSTGPPDAYDDPEMFLAQVEATGLVIEHEFGWRAEKVQIKTLWVSPHRVDEVRKVYPDITVVPWRRS